MYGFGHETPYTDFHELNLDFILKRIAEQDEKIANFIGLETIKYANPLRWNITTQYEKNTVVITDEGVAYISVKPVPSGVDITNTDFWTVIFNLDEMQDSIKSGITIYDEGNNQNATMDHSVGGWFWLRNELYRATVPITTGTTFVAGTNCIKISVESEVANISGSLDTINSSIMAINSTLSTVDGRLDYLENSDFLAHKRIILFGDSYAVENADGSWAADVYTKLNPNPDQVYKLAIGGAGFCGATGGYTFLQYLQAHISDIATPTTITDIYLLGGYNDISNTSGEIVSAIQAFLDYVGSVMPNALVHIGCVGWGIRGDNYAINRVVLPSYISGALSRRNGCYITNIEYANHDAANINPSPDMIHPNPTANAFIASQLLNVIKGHEPDINFEEIITFTPVNDSSDVAPQVASNSMHTSVKNDVTEFIVNGFNISWINGVTGFSATAFNGNFVKIGTLSGGNIQGFYEYSEFSIMIPITFLMSAQATQNDYEERSGWLCIAEGNVFVGINRPTGSPTAFTAFALHQLIITPFRYSIPSNCC